VDFCQPAQAQAQALQKKVLSTEAAVATVQQVRGRYLPGDVTARYGHGFMEAIRHQQDALKSSEDFEAAQIAQPLQSSATRIV
jgi:hypothetical protein